MGTKHIYNPMYGDQALENQDMIRLGTGSTASVGDKAQEKDYFRPAKGLVLKKRFEVPETAT